MRIDRGVFGLSCVLVLWAACSSDDAKQENPEMSAGAGAGGGKARSADSGGMSMVAGKGSAAGAGGAAGSAQGGAGGKVGAAGSSGKSGAGGGAAGAGGSVPKAGSGGGGAGGSKPAGGAGGSAGQTTGGAGAGGAGEAGVSGVGGSAAEEAGAGGAADSGEDIPPETPISLLFSDAEAEEVCAMARGDFDGGDLLTIHSGLCAEMAHAAGNVDESECRMAQSMCVEQLRNMHGVSGLACTLDDLPNCPELTVEQFVSCGQARLRAQNARYITLTCASDFGALAAFQTPQACRDLADVCAELASD